MRLTAEQSYAALEKFGCYVTEACDKCGRFLGSVRFTRRAEEGVWCSRDMPGRSRGAHTRKLQGLWREIARREAAQIVYCDDACRKPSARGSSEGTRSKAMESVRNQTAC